MNPNLAIHLGDSIPVAAAAPGVDLRPEVEAKARRLHDLARRTFPGWSPPPFDPLTLAEALGIPVRYAGTPPGCHALLIPDDRSGFRIICRKETRSEGRVRFSVAHELVHTFFDDALQVVRMRSRAKEGNADPEDLELERLCDAGAAEILMPRWSFQAAMDQIGARAAAVPALAVRFEVSLHAAALRFLECAGTALQAVGFFHYALRPSSRRGGSDTRFDVPAYRVQRVFARPKVPFLFPAGRSVPDSSAIYRCSLGRDEVVATETFELGGVAAAFSVAAYPLHRTASIDAPPTVCALFRGP